MLPILYSIEYLCPTGGMSGCGFNIKLFPAWKEAIDKLNLNQEWIDKRIEFSREDWLKKCMSWIKDPSFHKYDVRISWGEWGPEHLSVPGNACGLDIGTGIGRPTDGKILTPHNVDSVSQAFLLLVMFTEISQYVVCEMEFKEMEKKWSKNV